MLKNAALETQFILLGSRRNLDNENKERFAEIARQKLDWSKVYSSAILWGLLPPLYRNLIEVKSLVPSQFLKPFSLAYQQNLVRNLQLSTELIRLLHLLQQEEITAVPFKGPALAYYLYQDIALRRAACDLDIFVTRENVARVLEIVQANGYTLYQDHQGLSHEHYLQFKSHYILLGADRKPALEIHWDIAPGYFTSHFNFPQKIKNITTINYQQETLAYLNPADLMQCLCIHLARHLQKSLVWIKDIADLADQFDAADWSPFLQRCKKEQCQRVVLLGLGLSDHFFAPHLPDSVRKALKADNQVQKLVQRHARGLLETNSSQKMSSWKYALTYSREMFALQDSVKAKIDLATGRLLEMLTTSRLISTP